MPVEIQLHRGGQAGYTNSFTQGYRSLVSQGANKASLIKAAHVTGLEDEPALLRALLKSTLKSPSPSVSSPCLS